MKEKQLVFGMVLVLVAALAILTLNGSVSQNQMTGLVSGFITRDMTNITTVYSVAHVTRVQADYGFEEYGKMVAGARDLVEKCRALEEDTLLCINDNLEPGWVVLGNEGTYYLFGVASSYKTREYDPTQGKVVEKGILYRFALDFS